MNKLELEGKWNRIKGLAKEKYANLFDDDTTYNEAKLDQIIGKIQEKTGQTKEAIEKEIADWKENLQDNSSEN